MTDMWSIKEKIQHAILGFPKGMKKMQFLFLLLFALIFFAVGIFEICPGSDFMIIQNWLKMENFAKVPNFRHFHDCWN